MWKLTDSLKNKVVVVTGGNSGIGYFTIEACLHAGATVVMASRSEAKAMEAIANLKKITTNTHVHFMPLDLMKLSSVHKFVETFKNQFSRLDILVNNAGIMFGDYQVTEDGFESQMATNHFGHFALTGLLFDLLKKSKARIVNVSSIAHRRGEMDFDNLNFIKPKSYSPWGAYSRSKLANLLFTFELDRLVKAQHVPLTIVAAHPGVSKTNLLFKEKGPKPFYHAMKFLVPLQSAKKGAIPIIRAALDSSLVGGEYFGPSGLFEMGGSQAILVPSTPLAQSLTIARKLFEVSETLTKVNFPLKK
jgi:NAD(P)-dependent dehydrogenase (short-subunit alcohol dehydrogenase family)